MEAVTGLLCAACVLRFGADRDVWLPLFFVLLLVPIALIDIDHHIIPNVLTLIGAVVGFALVVAFQTDELTEHIIAAVGAGGFFLIAAIVYPSGMGMGDVKLAGVMGIFLGRDVVPAIFVALIAGTRRRRHHHRPPGLQEGPQGRASLRPLAVSGQPRRSLLRRRDRRLVPRHVRVALRVGAPPGSSRSKGVPIPGA